jgi:hypothetical protein
VLHPALRRSAWWPFTLAVLASVAFALAVSSLPAEQPVRRAAVPELMPHGAPLHPGLEPPDRTSSDDGDGSSGDAGSEDARDPRTSRGGRHLTKLPRAQRWTGLAFDVCRAPSSRKMDRWRVSSPFLGVGIYIGGAHRACPQKHLTRGWVRHQLRAGWQLLPIWVGRQASCTSYHKRISSRPGRRGTFPIARLQGARAARAARAAAGDLGIARGTTLWYDLEWFPPGNRKCRRAAVRFLSAWTKVLHRSGYRSGVYSSLSAGIEALWRVRGHGRLHAPDHVWFAWENGRRNSRMGREWIRTPGWKRERRVHQYALDERATYGGVSMRIDRNYVDLGGSHELRRTPARCGRDAAPGYRRLHRGDRGASVRGVQCLLRATGHYRGPVSGAYTRDTWRAVRDLQHDRGLPATGRVDAHTWTALLAAGAGPVLKRGSEGPAVRRLQRALTAALPGSVAVHGHFGPGTSQGVRRYQRRAGIRPTGVAGPATWRALRSGVLPHHAKPSRKHHANAGKHHRRHHGHQHRHGHHRKRGGRH